MEPTQLPPALAARIVPCKVAVPPVTSIAPPVVAESLCIVTCVRVAAPASSRVVVDALATSWIVAFCTTLIALL